MTKEWADDDGFSKRRDFLFGCCWLVSFLQEGARCKPLIFVFCEGGTLTIRAFHHQPISRTVSIPVT